EENYLVPLLLCLQNIIVFIASLAVMIYLSPLVMLCLFAAVILLIALPSLFQTAIQNRQDRFSKNQSNFTVAIKDFLSGFEVIRSYQMNSHTVKAFGKKNNTVYTAQYALGKMVAAVEGLSAVLGVMVQCSVLFVSAYLIIKGKLTAGALVGLVQVSGTIVAPIQVLSQSIPQIQGSKPIIERLNNLANYKDNTFVGTIPPTFETDITVKNLQFGYEQEQKIIQGIDFSFKKGKKYAVVGKSGCGKTTLINLLSGYYAKYDGEVLYDGVDIRKLDIDKLNEMSSVIHQNVYMFDESIQDNICLHKQIAPVNLQKALDMSGVAMFLGEEKTLDTSVGENGNNLSGGQRQRVAVARALVQGKPILILDEGTSAVDMQTAYDIESQLLKISELTVITITHSLNQELLENYDQVIFMENGAITEAGSYAKLMENKGAFYDFVSLKK
ncbi:MAG: ABC transporter ATP-binding protein, partial [Oscillospiraceae bacterium]|nr:ABC transporter ATP-binding protein [Oscillospiraceae bacterium]